MTGASGPVLNQTGGFGSAIKDSAIARRLFEDFSAPLMNIMLKGSPVTQNEVEEQIEKLNYWAYNQGSTWLDSQLKGKRRELKPVDQIW